MIKHYVVNGHDRYCIEFQRQSNGTFKLYAREHPPDPYGKPVNDNHLYASGEICVAAGYEPTTPGRAVLPRARALASPGRAPAVVGRCPLLAAVVRPPGEWPNVARLRADRLQRTLVRLRLHAEPGLSRQPHARLSRTYSTEESTCTSRRF